MPESSASPPTSGRVAILRASGVVDLITRSGRLINRVDVGRARAISLRKNAIAVLGDNGALRIYETGSREIRRAWRVPTSATTVDVHFGIALLTAGRSVYALDVASGRTVRVFRGRARIMAQLEAPGAAIAFNLHGHGDIRFIPMSSIEQQLRRR